MRTPRVSLLIAMRNEAAQIERCLRSVLAQDYPNQDLEVYVLDGESTDASWQIVASMFEGRSNCHIVRNPGRTQGRGWNLGIERATGEIIGIVGAHSELAPDYVATSVETLHRTGADLVGGPMRAAGGGPVGRAVALATSTPFGVGGARFHYTDREEEVDTVYMGLCRKRVYERIGGFDPEMVRDQDDEWSYRLLDHGGRIICNPAIRSRYYNRVTFSALWRQYFQYGYWKVRVFQKHPRQMRFRQVVPPLFVASLVILALVALNSSIGPTPLLIIITAYSLANLMASLLAARKGGWRNLPLLPLVFATLHLSYGVGFLHGAIERLLRPAAIRTSWQ